MQSCEERVENSILMLRPIGVLRGASSARLRQRLDRALADNTDVVVDLGSVPSVDSTGLGVMIHATTTARTHCRSLTFAAPSARVKAMIERTRLQSVITLSSSVEAAMERIR
ncbi:hypothetical protein NJ76_20455 [Rhodococcus sp. IITR03]|nr:hypothetical protein NJ76_20455 [Rhodococcus sp. IITR03]